MSYRHIRQPPVTHRLYYIITRYDLKTSTKASMASLIYISHIKMLNILTVFLEMRQFVMQIFRAHCLNKYCPWIIVFSNFLYLSTCQPHTMINVEQTCCLVIRHSKVLQQITNLKQTDCKIKDTMFRSHTHHSKIISSVYKCQI